MVYGSKSSIYSRIMLYQSKLTMKSIKWFLNLAALGFGCSRNVKSACTNELLDALLETCFTDAVGRSRRAFLAVFADVLIHP